MSTATNGRAREYRRIPGFPDYDVSTDGIVRSWIPWKQTEVPRVLRQYENTSGYLTVRPTAEGRQRTMPVHRLIALAYMPPPRGGEVLRHLNDDKHDNRLENLAWGTRSENGMDSVRNGKHFPASLTVCRRGHALTDSNVYIYPKSGKRMCRACHAMRGRRGRQEAAK